MRNEITRLMYGAGDVEEPDMDSVEYMEDLLVDFFSDLCRPLHPIRSTTATLHQAVPLTSGIIRHRLSSSSSTNMRKYLNRFDEMLYMSGEIARSKRILQPSNADLIATVGNGFLELEDDGDRPRKRMGRPPKGKDEHGNKIEKKKKDWREGERKKPGPAKGWKANLSQEQQQRLKVLGYKKGYRRKP
ncbi:hypothetical protein TREMEDRAFT_56607 [Tremella mesenterica DSM 1558]|nr:uncharacterized protein TREMEDRAFT_56607 [Tremella mesenterica DSM 1558]EIW70511.1 hypothetical protein TREMEDRAFT_56607 [Tremella mesenterica DSM 1558]